MTGEGTILMAGASGWSGLILKVVDGKVAIKGRNKIIKTLGPIVNDGQWHHVAVSHNTNGSLESAPVYVDGQLVQKESTGTTTLVPYTRVAVAVGVEWTWYDGTTLAPFKGLMDDPGHWAGVLSETEVKALYNSVVNSDLKYNSARMDSLFRIYRSKSAGSVAGKTWSYTGGLTGTPGSITKNGAGDYSVVLDASGLGVTTGTVAVLRSGIRADKEIVFSVRQLTNTCHLVTATPLKGHYTVRVFSASGRCMQVVSGRASGKLSLALEQNKRLLPGSYIVSIDTDRGSSIVRFVKP
jgi:hypothetical protein